MDQSEIPKRIQGRRDLGLRIEGKIAPEQERTISDANDLLAQFGAALENLFDEGLEQTRISDAVKNDASQMVNTADQTKDLVAQGNVCADSLSVSNIHGVCFLLPIDVL